MSDSKENDNIDIFQCILLENICYLYNELPRFQTDIDIECFFDFFN